MSVMPGLSDFIGAGRNQGWSEPAASTHCTRESSAVMSSSRKSAGRGGGSTGPANVFRDLRQRNDRRARLTEAEREYRSKGERAGRTQQERRFRLGG